MRVCRRSTLQAAHLHAASPDAPLLDKRIPPLAKYSIAGNKGTASVRSIINHRADAGAPSRGRVLDYMVGSITTPADSAFDHELYRTSTAGTGAANTPSPLDPADTAAVNDSSDTYTVDPTIGVLLLRVPLNQRATYRWVAAPDCGLVFPATASNGITGGVASATTTDFSATMIVDSQ